MVFWRMEFNQMKIAMATARIDFFPFENITMRLL